MILHPHSPDWLKEFSAIETVLKNTLGAMAPRIEHIGSTAIPGLRAKPILDIDVVMPDYSFFPAIVEKLRQLGYTHSGDQGIPEREAFNRADTSTPWGDPTRAWMDHHLYVCPSTSRELQRHLVFRDALLRDPKIRERYEAVKTEIETASGGDRKRYAHIKETTCRAFIEDTLKQSGFSP
jgi:GrpB-like predicted nucleotidyltransferase (UPF0157 family)